MFKRQIISLSFFLFPFIGLWAQGISPDWEVNFTDSNRSFIQIIEGSLFVDDEVAPVDDYLGVFTVQDNEDVCLGFVKWSNRTTFIGINGNFNTSDILFLKHWDHIRGCQYSSTVSEILLTVTSLVNSDDFLTLGKIESRNINAPVSFQDSYVFNESPVIQNLPASENISFFSSSDSLSIDNDNGTIFISDSYPGTYEIFIVSNTCYSQNTFTVEISAEFEEIILSPTSTDPRFHQVFFEENERVEIFDKTGRLIISFEGPSQWDARDRYGKKVSTDDYFVKIGDTTKVITVIQ